MSCSTSRSARRASPRTASPSPRRSSSRTSSRTWWRRWCAKSHRRPMTRPATAPPPLPYWPPRTILAAAIGKEGAKSVAAGMNPMDLKRGIDIAVHAVVKDLEKRAKPVGSSAEVAQVGTISSNGDATIGSMIAKAMQKVGNEGVITVEEAKAMETEVEIVEGMQFDRGYISPYFITNAEKMIAELEDAYILLHEKKLSGLQAMLPLLEAVVQTSKPLLIL